MKKYANGKRKKGADKRTELAHKICNKIHGVMNNINTIYCESIHYSHCYRIEKSKFYKPQPPTESEYYVCLTI